MSKNTHDQSKNKSDLRLWGIFGLIALASIGFLLLRQPTVPLAGQPTSTAAYIPSTQTFVPEKLLATTVPTVTISPQPTPTSIALVWRQLSDGTGFSRDTVTSIGFDSEDPNLLYLDTVYAGVYKSSDGGLSWVPDSGHIIDSKVDLSNNVQWKDPSDGNTFFRTYTNLYSGNWFSALQKSTDDGKVWVKIKDLQSGPYTMAFDPSNKQIKYLGEDNSLSKTQDGGDSWKKLYSFPTDYIAAVELSPADPQTIFVGTQGLFVSKNAGGGWQNQSQGIGAARIELLINPNTSTLYILEKQKDEYEGYIRRIGRSSDNGKTWEFIMNEAGSGFSFGTGENIFYAYKRYPLVMKSANSGKNWVAFFNGDTGNQHIYKMILAHPKAENILYSIQTHENPSIQISQNGGKTWQDINYTNYNLQKLYFDHDQGHVIYATLDDSVTRSEDDGQTWNNCQAINNELTFSESGLAIDPQDSNTLYIALKTGGLKMSTDGCLSWLSRNTGLTNLNINSIAIDPNNSNVVYVGTAGGAFVSYDKGEHWGPINDGLIGTTIVYSIAVDAQSNVYATTPYGVFQLGPK